MTENKQIFELNDEELDNVAGGVVRVNGNTNRIGFSTLKKAYDLKNCSYYEARNLCESLLGQYSNETEHEAACEAALKAKGWI